MSLFSRIFNRSTASAPLLSPGLISTTGWAGAHNDSVTPQTAMQITTVWACNRIIAETISSIGLHLYRRTDAGKERDTDHPIYPLIHSQPNPMMTSIQWREWIVTDLNTRGTHFSQILRNQRGDIMGLYPLIHDAVKYRVNDDATISYSYTTRGTEYPLDHSDVLRIVGIPSANGVTGLSPITANESALNLGKTAETFGKNFFANGANATGAFKTDGALNDTAYKRLKKDLEREYTGLSNSSKPLLLEGGMDFVKFSLTNNDSQFLETRKYQKEEIASIFRVPMHMINALDKASFSNIEHQSLEFVKYTILPWARRIETALEVALLTEAERRAGYTIRFNVDTLLRGDFKTRTEGYATLFNIGAISQNEIRSLENFNSIGAEGDKYYVQLNMTPTQGDT